MAVTNSLSKYDEQNKKTTFSSYLIPKKNNIEEILGKERTIRFVSSITSAIATTPALADCENYSLLSGALLGESLGLAHSPQLGQYYLVPFKKKLKNKDGQWEEKKLAQFILGVQGWKQLAIRSGQYETLNVIPVVEGEYKGRDRFSGEPTFEFIESDEERNKRKVVGYMAYFKLINGFSKVLYRTKDEMLDHADRYSQAFSRYGEKTDKYVKVSYEDYLLGKFNPKDEYLYSSFWYKGFDTMACGKVLKKLIKEYGVLSVDLQSAIDKDDKIIESYEKNENGIVEINALEVENATTTENLSENKETIEESEQNGLRGKTTAKKGKVDNKDTVESFENTQQDNILDDFFG